ncbi:uncharacterized protein Z519_09011 [Cladophialophora bantiana CBS 173.52]|uniref:Uncharacterized protein n=1 Tax=Cladophialophora bantiana (strain ATCC 10958 / CBS 173.52 / CDC B-1940 / NIH 8579) TaxID=1442370 RepID=A0A0D2EK37_CLAB1|nr:uncharacterized protein Z519_09011 [Cladophialophora bantiana CBS 173.52]KIW90366.1 hypothetical protein Z519_09011 [Cladophialophora bantiana CBS 173.52]
MADAQEPLEQTEVEDLRKMLLRRRDSPPPNDSELELFKYDAERHGFVDALNLPDFSHIKEEEACCDDTDQEQEHEEESNNCLSIR